MISKKILIILVFISVSGFSWGQVDVPVHDMQIEMANKLRHKELTLSIGDSSTQISAQVQNSIKGVTQQQDEINRQNAVRMGQHYVLEQRRQNAERHSVKFGAKVKDACAFVKGAREINSGQIAKQKIFNESMAVAYRYLERGRYKSPNEPVMTGEAASLLTKFARVNQFEKANASKAANSSMIDKGLSLSTTKGEGGLSEYSIEFEKKMLLLNPFADKIPENYDSPNQPAAQIANSAHVKWKNEIIRAVATNEMYLLANKATTFSDAWANSLFEASSDGVAMKQIAMGDAQKQGYYSTLDVLNKARLFSPDWIKYTNNGMTERALMADANYMQAQSLVNQGEIIRLLIMLNENAHAGFANDMRYYWKSDQTSTSPQ